MKKLPALFAICLLACGVCTLSSCGRRDGIVWNRVADLPDPAGLKGMFSGVTGGRILLAGGSNFPTPRSEGGKKTFSNRIFTAPANNLPGLKWTVDETTLPVGLSEGASVAIESGVVVIGGSRASGATADVLLLGWDDNIKKVIIKTLPHLPEPLANAAAAYWHGKIYVAGGENTGRVSDGFYSLDMKKASAKWEKLPSLPGTPRFGALMTVLKTADGDRLFLFGGRAQSSGAVKETDYLADGFSYDFSTQTWRPAAPMPHRALAATGARINERQFAVMGGSDGHDLDKMAELGERYRLPDHIMLYDTGADRWREIGKLPLGVAGASAIQCGNQWIIAGGEPSPALRINHVYMATFPDYN